MEYAGKLISNPECRLDEKDNFIVQIEIRIYVRFKVDCIYILKGKVAATTYRNLSKGDKVRIKINKNHVVYSVVKAD